MEVDLPGGDGERDGVHLSLRWRGGDIIDDFAQRSVLEPQRREVFEERTIIASPALAQ